MKKYKIFVPLMVIFLFLSAAMVEVVYENMVYMPLVFKDGYYYDTPTPTATLTPTATKTPKPPTPTPTATPTYIVAEGGNSCVYIWDAVRTVDGGTRVISQAPSVCSYLTIHSWQDHPLGNLLIVKAERIKTDTYGCEEDDFGPLVKWPPIDGVCPPPEIPPDPFSEDPWGDIETLTLERSAAIVCGYCEECGVPFTLNCKEVRR